MSIVLLNYLNLQNKRPSFNLNLFTFQSFFVTSSVHSHNYATVLAAVWNSGAGKFADADTVLYTIGENK
jgi:hypothetical protein